MVKSSRRTLFVLLSVVLVALISGLLLTWIITRDFRNYLESERSAMIVLGSENAGRSKVNLPDKDRMQAFSAHIGIVTGIGVFLSSMLTLGLWNSISRKRPGAFQDSIPTAENSSGLNRGPRTALRKKEHSVNLVAAPEDGPEFLPEDDPLDADDDDMQPLAGDPDRISRIVKGLDGLAKAQALRSALRKQQLELLPYLNGIIEKTRASGTEARVTFKVECDEKLDLSADPECLAGIMTNLLDNAIKSVKHDGTVTLSASEKGDQIELAVSDTGCGIRQKALPHIFERFYRGSGDGIGLGLTIVKELVDACKGTISVRSTRGKGSVFIVCVPRA